MRSSKFLLTALAATLASSMTLMGCKDDDQASSPTPNPTPPPTLKAKSGVLVDSIVEGLAYSAVPSGKSGMTQADGRFDYTQGDAVTFSFGSIQLPAFTPENNQSTIVSVYDIANDDEVLAQEIGRFLQTLDEDGNVNNGIQLPDASKLTSDYSNLSFTDTESLDGSLSAMIAELALSPRLVVTAQEAKTHMDESQENALEFTQTWIQSSFDEADTEQINLIETVLIDTQSTVVVKSGGFNADDLDGVGIMWKFSPHPVFDADPDYVQFQDPTTQVDGYTCYFLLTQTTPSGGDMDLNCDELPVWQALGIWDVDAGVLGIRLNDSEGSPESYLALSLVQGANMQTVPPIMYSYWDAIDEMGEPVGDAEILILGDLIYFTPKPAPEPIALTLNAATTDQTTQPFSIIYSLAVVAGEYYNVDLSNVDNNTYLYVCDDDAVVYECNLIDGGAFDNSTASMALTFQAKLTGHMFIHVFSMEVETTVSFDIIAKAANVNALVLASTATDQSSLSPNPSVYTLEVEQGKDYQIQLSNQDEDAVLAACTSLLGSQHCAASEFTIASVAYTANTPGAGLSFTAATTGTVYVYVLAKNEATTLSFDIQASDITSAP